MGRPAREKNEITALMAKRLNILNEEKKRILEKEKGRRVSSTEIASYSEYLRDMQTPSLETINKLANYFHVTVDYLLGSSNVRNPDLYFQALDKTKLSDNAIQTLLDYPEALPFINSLLESKELHDLSRSFRRLMIALGKYYEDGKLYDYLEKPTSFPILDDEEDGEKILLREVMEEQNMDTVKFCEYLLRDTFDMFTASIVKQEESR